MNSELFKKVFQKIKADITIPKERKIDVSKKNIRNLRIIEGIAALFAGVMFICCLFDVTAKIWTYIYYAYLFVTSLIVFIGTFFSSKVNKYYFNQFLVVLASSFMGLMAIYSLYTSTSHFSGVITFYIICICLILFFDVNPFFHVILISVYCICFFFFTKVNYFDIVTKQNHLMYCIVVVILGFYKRKLTSRNERQALKIQEQTRQLEVQNIELSAQKDSLIAKKQFLEDTVFNQSQKIQLQNERLINIQDRTIISLSNLVENRDADTGEHVQRTRDYVGLIATKAFLTGNYPELNENIIRLYLKAAPMHDIGKIVVPDAVLKKPGKLTPEEFELIKLHTTQGAKIVDDVLGSVEDEEYVRITKEIVTSHHEKYDGTGYPYGLKGENIPLSARIMAIADVFDALVSPRCYKEPFPVELAFKMIKEAEGSHFDPELAENFVNAKPEVLEILAKYQQK